MTESSAAAAFPTPLEAYTSIDASGLLQDLQARVALDPFNAVATGIFFLAVLHTFVAARFIDASHRAQARHDAASVAAGRVTRPSVRAELLHFLGEVEVVFALWGVPLVVAIALSRGWHTVVAYLNDSVNYTEPMFVVVIMALASTRPIVELAENALRRVATLGGGTPAAWWAAILTAGPLLASLITEPGAMTIAAMLLARQFYELRPSGRLRYATLGLLFVNVSIGGTLTHFAAPPVLMVARAWAWDTPYVLGHFGWRATIAIFASTLLYYAVFRGEFETLARQKAAETNELDAATAPALSVPWWLTVAYVLFMVWTVANAHYPALFLAGFLFFLGFDAATSAYSTLKDFRTPLLVGFFLAGLVVHGGLQAWWIAPVLARLGEFPLFLGATILTAFNDNALITYLSTLVPELTPGLKHAVVAGAVTGGGLTVIANAPNPAGQAILGRYFDDAVHPLYLFAGALVPTVIAAAAFRLL